MTDAVDTGGDGATHRHHNRSYERQTVADSTALSEPHRSLWDLTEWRYEYTSFTVTILLRYPSPSIAISCSPAVATISPSPMFNRDLQVIPHSLDLLQIGRCNRCTAG
ncbi:hypothetical protein IG631_15747 [Alternaria alternata]|nr:hypothetical protein IG631_15747 [Alternaria alternata]